MAAAVKLSRSLQARLWDGCPAKCRQLSGVGKLLGDRLLAAGFGDLKDMLAGVYQSLDQLPCTAHGCGVFAQARTMSTLYFRFPTT